MTTNEQIAQIFDEIGDILEILGESVFRIRAYRRGAEVVRNYPDDMEELHKNMDEQIENISGIGKDLHAKIVEIIDTGECEMHQRLIQQIGPGILDMLRIRGIGPKKVKLFHDMLEIDNLEKLRSAAESGALAALPRMGEKSQQAILDALNQGSISKERIPYDEALAIAEAYIAYMKKLDAVKEIAYAGSLRRQKATIGDIDLLVTGEAVPEIMEHFVSHPDVINILGQGDTKSSVLLKGNKQVDLRVVPAESFGAALFYFTGPKQFNIHVRTLALRRGLKVNEYGLYDGQDQIAGRTEEGMFKGLDLAYLEPQEREDWG